MPPIGAYFATLFKGKREFRSLRVCVCVKTKYFGANEVKSYCCNMHVPGHLLKNDYKKSKNEYVPKGIQQLPPFFCRHNSKRIQKIRQYHSKCFFFMTTLRQSLSLICAIFHSTNTTLNNLYVYYNLYHSYLYKNMLRTVPDLTGPTTAFIL